MEHELTQQLLDWVRSHYFGKYRGIVTSNQDPTERGRLKVQVPSILESLEIWAMPCVPYAGAGVGFYSLPEGGTGVWVEFEAGDPSYPVWTGCFWADGELPDKSDASVKIWKTEKLTLRIDDSGDVMMLQTSSDSMVTLNSDVKIESGGASQTIGGVGVVSEIGKGKVDVNSGGVIVNSGSLELS